MRGSGTDTVRSDARSARTARDMEVVGPVKIRPADLYVTQGPPGRYRPRWRCSCHLVSGRGHRHRQGVQICRSAVKRPHSRLVRQSRRGGRQDRPVLRRSGQARLRRGLVGVGNARRRPVAGLDRRLRFLVGATSRFEVVSPAAELAPEGSSTCGTGPERPGGVLRGVDAVRRQLISSAATPCPRHAHVGRNPRAPRSLSSPHLCRYRGNAAAVGANLADGLLPQDCGHPRASPLDR